MAGRQLDETVFANVDLDIYSSTNLQPLVDAFGDRIFDLWTGRVKRTYQTHLELEWKKNQTPNSIILGFCRLVESLTPSTRRLWSSAKKKSFDIGIHAPALNHYYWSAVSPEAVRAAADVGAQIAITVYGAMKASKTKAKPSSSSK